MAIDRILQEALALSVEDRERLASALLRSLDVDVGDHELTDEQWNDAWAAELDRRAKEIDAGAPTLSAREFVSELRALHAKP